ncbi:phage virion morphogenesis protein [Vibrio furnissii]|uniref:phage virion morphogenesis protein n=1 Tax=Vibrio furnissii TaxID=29494 RepID=UPI001559F043|nr:phage virion morphogenesis protein [Vibrio furnissii]
MSSNANQNFDFSAVKLSTPEELTQLVNRLVISAEERFDLNRRMANRARQFFRQQIRAQRDIDNNPYQSRRRRVSTRVYYDMSGRSFTVAKNTVNNKNMLLGLSRSLKTNVDHDGFEVGLTGVAAAIGRKHNDGGTIEFTTRVHGYYDSRTGRWRGGQRTKNNYQMPQRTFLGWTPLLERELLKMAASMLALKAA